MFNPAQHSSVRIVNGDLQVQLRVVEKHLARVQAHLAWIVFLFIFDGLDELYLAWLCTVGVRSHFFGLFCFDFFALINDFYFVLMFYCFSAHLTWT